MEKNLLARVADPEKDLQLISDLAFEKLELINQSRTIDSPIFSRVLTEHEFSLCKERLVSSYDVKLKNFWWEMLSDF